jgi:hypothetical protein
MARYGAAVTRSEEDQRASNEGEKQKSSGAVGEKEIGLGFDGTDAEVVIRRGRSLDGRPIDHHGDVELRIRCHTKKKATGGASLSLMGRGLKRWTWRDAGVGGVPFLLFHLIFLLFFALSC